MHTPVAPMRGPPTASFRFISRGAPFGAGATFATMTVLAQTPAKLVTFTFTNVTIQAADVTTKSDERITFAADNYAVKFSGDSAASGHTGTQ